MKLNGFMTFISLILCGLIFFGFYKWDGDLLIAIGSAVVSLLLLTTTFALTSTDTSRSATMVKLVSGIMFLIMLIINIFFAKNDATSTTYIITNGIGVCIWAIMFYGIAKAKQ